MSAGSRALRFLQLGKSTNGANVAATTIWRGLGAIQEERDTQFPPEDVGIAGGADRSYVPNIGATLQMESTPVTFEQLPYVLTAGVQNTTTGTADGTQGSGRAYAYALSTTAANSLTYYTIEGGDNQQEEEFNYGFVESFQLTGQAAAAWMMTANWRGREVTAGTKTAALSIPTVEEALFQKTSLYVDAEGGTIGTTQVSNTLIAATLDVTTGFQARWTADGNLYFSQPVLGIPEVNLALTFLYNGSAVTEKANWRTQTPRQVRLRCTGDALTTVGTYATKIMDIDLAGRWISFDKLGEDNGNDIIVGNFRARYNSTAALYAELLIVNELTSLT